MITVGFDASRCRSGGAISHILGILNEFSSNLFGIKNICIWGSSQLLKKIPDRYEIKKIDISWISSNLIFEILWQKFFLKNQAVKEGVNVMFKLDAGSVCTFSPNVVLHQDLLAFEENEVKKFPFYSLFYWRLKTLKSIQIRSLSKATKQIFLSKYSKKTLSKYLCVKNSKIIYHGINKKFLQIGCKRNDYSLKKIPYIVYVSHIMPYKHHDVVIHAVSKIFNINQIKCRLEIIGGGSGIYFKKICKLASKIDPYKRFINIKPFIKNSEVLNRLKQCDIFVFASSCETFGITLLEAMACALPIACSNKSSLPEIVKNAAVFFNPDSIDSCALAILTLLESTKKRKNLGQKAYQRAQSFSWKICASKTFRTLANSYCL